MPAVFLSHSSKDKPFVRDLYARLTRDGVDCFFDAESIGWGDNWVRALERALDECTQIILVLSPDFCNSEWVEVERTSSLADDPSGLKRKVRPLMLHDCRSLPTFPRFLKQIQSLDVSTPSAFEANYPKICCDLGGVLIPDITTADRTKLPPIHPLPDRHRMPYHSLGDKFVGRVDDLWKIHDALHSGSTAILQGVGVVAGTGGLGKTQTAIEYAHRFGAAYPGGVYWVDADRGLSTLISQVSDNAGIVIEKKAEEPAQLLQLWAGLNRLPPSLIVLDNFPEDIALRPYLPVTGRVHTLVTTRRQDLTSYSHVRLNILSPEAGTQLLNSGVRQLKPGEASLLVERLGGLPLALELTRSFLNERVDATVQQILDAMQTTGEMEVLRGFVKNYRDELPSRHERDVAGTFQMSWELAPATGKQVLRVMAELAPFAVPRKILRRSLGMDQPKGLTDDLADSLAELRRLSMVEFDSADNPLMHRLIHAFVRYRNTADDVSPFDQTAKVVLDEMGAAFENPGAATLRELESLVPHAEALFSGDRLTANESVNLVSSIARHHKSIGRYNLARSFSQQALAFAEQSFEAGHPSIASCQSNLAVVLQDLGRLEEARDLLRQALSSDEQSFETGHPTIAIRQSNLATVLQDLGRLEEARDLLRQALSSDEQSYEAEHPSIAISQSNLALVLQDLGQLEEARDLLRHALASYEKSFEAGHPSIASCQSNLATVLRALGQLEEARDLLRQALSSDGQSYEARHPFIAVRQSNLALVLRDLGQLEEARDLLRRALSSDEQSYEAGHPSIAISQSNLALVLRDLGQLEEARDLLRQALSSDEQSYEAGHPSIVLRQSNLALVLNDLGQLEEAHDLLTKAVAAARKVFKPGHPSLVTYQENLESVEKAIEQQKTTPSKQLQQPNPRLGRHS
jgi:tetratricopeptide (TPR) repeat protein